jgi:hypothetical protein
LDARPCSHSFSQERGLHSCLRQNSVTAPQQHLRKHPGTLSYTLFALFCTAYSVFPYDIWGGFEV